MQDISAGQYLSFNRTKLDKGSLNRNILNRTVNPCSRQLQIFTHTKSIIEKSFTFQVIKMWNKLPDVAHEAADKASLTGLLLNSPELLSA